MDNSKICLDYLEALALAQEAKHRLETNDGDSYDPCGDTARRVQAEFDEVALRLAQATKALIEMAG